MQKDDLNTIGFAAIICVVCSLGLAGVRASLKPIQDENIKIDGQLQVLKALRPDFKPDGTELTQEEQDLFWTDGKAPKELIGKYFVGNVTTNQVTLAKAGEQPLYSLTRDNKTVAVAFPASGKGLWSTIHSYIGLEQDMSTIRGITFFGHAETPGLGGECSKPWFQKQWQGKQLMKDGEIVRIKVDKNKGTADNPHAVDGMSGATITGNGIQKFVDVYFNQYNEAAFTGMR